MKLEESKAVEVRRLAIMLMVRAQQDQAACRQELCCGSSCMVVVESAVPGQRAEIAGLRPKRRYFPSMVCLNAVCCCIDVVIQEAVS